MYLLKTQKYKIIFKVIAFMLIQSFLLLEIAWAQGVSFLDTSQDTLSPKILINSASLQDIFSIKEKIIKGKTTALPDLTYNKQRKESLEFEAYNLQDGYGQLTALISNISDKKRPILCVEGDVSAGKTTFVKLIKEIGISNIMPRNILFISIDDIKNDLQEVEGFSLLEAILEMPLEIEQMISRAGNNIDLIVIEGSEGLDYMAKADFKPDIMAIVKASKKTRFIRHLMKHGLFAAKFFDEPYGLGEVPNNSPVLYIENEVDTKTTFLPIAVKILAKTLQIIVSKMTNFIAPNLLDSLKSSDLFRRNKGFGLPGLIIFSLKMFSYLINRIVDLYFILNPQRNMLAIIKQRFKGKIKVLDVGTGDGSFVENFQNLLDKKGIEGVVYGIDIDPSKIVQGLHLSRNVQTMDVKDAQAHFGKASFDIITITAPDRPAEYLIAESMGLLKPDGILILRLHKGAHYESFFGADYREKLIERLKISYDVTSFKKHIYNLPNGNWYKLQPPIIISSKDMQADIEGLLEAADSYLEQAQLDEALTLKKYGFQEDVADSKVTQNLERLTSNLTEAKVIDLKRVRDLIAQKKSAKQPESSLQRIPLSINLYQLIGQSI